MRDFEVFKTGGGVDKNKETFQMSVNGKWYHIPRKMRNWNNLQLMNAYERDELREVVIKPKTEAA
jgi:hypothetical protein